MSAAAKVVGNMVEVAGAILGESFFNKEIGLALQSLDGELHLCQGFSRRRGCSCLHGMPQRTPSGSSANKPFGARSWCQYRNVRHGAETRWGTASSQGRLSIRSRSLQWRVDSASVRSQSWSTVLPVCPAGVGQDMDATAGFQGMSSSSSQGNDRVALSHPGMKSTRAA